MFVFVFDLMLCGRLNANITLNELVLYSAAPLATAVHLSQALSLACLREEAHFVDLQAAAHHCEIMAPDLLKLASVAEGLDVEAVLRAVDHWGTLILVCLIEGKQKHAMSIPALQMYLTKVWYGSLQWKSWKILLLFFSMLFSGWPSHFPPKHKICTHTASYK